jgi:SAM-dependent methyltransferase
MPANTADETAAPVLKLPLDDGPHRDYSGKLRLFNLFARPEIRAMIGGLGLAAGMRVLDAGCGTGESLVLFQAEVAPAGTVVGIELSSAHASASQAIAAGMQVSQGDLMTIAIAPAEFDLIWSANTIHHLPDPLLAVQRMSHWLKPRGRLALLQSSLLPEMFFAWDARLERVTNEAIREYYRHRYKLDERDLASVRSIVGLLRRAQLKNVTARSVLIERVSPLDAASEAYLQEAIFRDTWGERLRPYLSADDFAELTALCDPHLKSYALHRPDFHFLQTLTLATGEKH